MIVTGALLAESASVVDNKLNVTGGVVSTYRMGSHPIIPVTLVVLTRSQPFDMAPTLTVTITNPAGESRDVELEVPLASLGGEIGFFCVPLRIPVPALGRYTVVLPAQGGSIELPLTVVN
ncbi:MAG: hypothetical protein SW019_01395 [Actinomycetota bacterium]|nr:hypothetical protein [Actinomycetota bacterium]